VAFLFFKISLILFYLSKTFHIIFMDQFTLFPEPPKISNHPTRSHGKPRLNTAERHQVELTMAALDDLIPPDHKVRFVWAYVEKLDLSLILGSILSVEGTVGRPATDPKILLAIWLYATLEGIVSARVIADYCKEHVAYKWLCGGVSMNHHTISDFSTKHSDQFDAWLTESVAILMREGLVSLEETAQDGMRVRACASTSSFHREKTLCEHYEEAKHYLNTLRKNFEKNPNQNRSRKEAAAKRAAEEREEKITKALQELKKFKEEKCKNAKKHHKKKPKEEELEECRVSTSDPEARKMKMADGGFRPAYNVQFVTDTASQAIVGVDVNNRGNDTGLIKDMIGQIDKRYGIVPVRTLQDAGYTDYGEIDGMAERYQGCKIYMPIRQSDKRYSDSKDSAAVAEWKQRMGTQEAKEIYKRRGSTAECSNAQARNRGLQQFIVKGIKKAKQVILRYAIAHNMQRYFSLKGI
jgi:transposase